MKRVKAALALSAVLLSATASAPSLAHHGRHGHFGVFIGAPFYPWWYYPPYYSYPQVITVPAAPTTYIEQGSPQATPAQPQGYWYYCGESKTYYPYVKECAGSWQRVTPQPPPGG